jgi:hypothetical protein
VCEAVRMGCVRKGCVREGCVGRCEGGVGRV